MGAGADLADGLVIQPAPAPPRRRMPLRTIGLLAILAILALISGLVGLALVFRAMVQDHLSAIEIALKLGMYAHPDMPGLLVRARQYMDDGTLLLIGLGWLGIAVVGAVGVAFFWRLAADIAAVRARAMAIVTGDRSRGRPLARQDELGDLGRAVDDLADALARRERELEFERRNAMHQEKLATIGSMAAGVLREIGNPVAAIDGYAQALVDAQREGAAAPPPAWYDPSALLDEARRLVDITRDIAMLAAAPATQRELVSINEVVARSASLLRYEPRLQDVAVVTSLDPQLPAINGIGDRLVLLVTNLMVNAADAMASRPSHTARIDIATRMSGGGVELEVKDNGCGMTDEVLARAFEPLFTTKAPGIGTGLGLPLCRSITEEHGGSISLAAEAGRGTRVLVWFPAPG